MLLNAVILVLREVIEAALIFSLFLAFSQLFGRAKVSLLLALVMGLVLATFYALNINSISQWLDGVGQEIINASICFLIYLLLLIFVIRVISEKTQQDSWLSSATMIAGIILATTQEGAEIILYIHGFSFSPELFRPVLFGSLIGAGIGLSVGIFIYYLLINLSKTARLGVGFVIVLLIAGSTLLQSAQLLTQADWIPSQYPLWDSSTLISEHSFGGQMLYALVGYEATPTPIQVISYLVGLMLILVLSGYFYFYHKKPPHA